MIIIIFLVNKLNTYIISNEIQRVNKQIDYIKFKFI